MSTLTTIVKPAERIVNDPYWLRQFSVAEYHQMIEAGILTSNDRVELLRAGQFPAFVAVFGPDAFVTGFAEPLPQCLANHRLIFDDQQFHPQCSRRVCARNHPI